MLSILHLSKFTRARTPSSVLLAPPNFAVTSRGPDCRVVTRCAGAAGCSIVIILPSQRLDGAMVEKKLISITMDNCTSLTLPASFLFSLESYSSCSSFHFIPAPAQLYFYLLVPLGSSTLGILRFYCLSLLSLLLLFFHVPCLLQLLTRVVHPSSYAVPCRALLQSCIYTPPIDPFCRIHSRLYTVKHNVPAPSVYTNQQSSLKLFSNLVALSLPINRLNPSCHGRYNHPASGGRPGPGRRPDPTCTFEFRPRIRIR